MIKIYRIREDGSYKDFYCNTKKEADEKLKLQNFTSIISEDKKFIVSENDEVKIKEIIDRGYSREYAVRVIKEV